MPKKIKPLRPVILYAMMNKREQVIYPMTARAWKSKCWADFISQGITPKTIIRKHWSFVKLICKPFDRKTRVKK